MICDRCLAGIEINNSLFCPVCRARLWQDKKICNHGQSDGRQYPFVLAAAANYGNETTQNLITYFKYKGFESLAPILSSFVFKYINFINLDLEDYIIVPIPLHKNRERKRGFNQAKLLADNLSERLEIDSIDALRRIKNTKPQACLSGRQAKLKNQKDDNIFLAFIDIIIIWSLIIFLIWNFAKIKKSAAWLLTPYLLWVSFATVLNFSLLLLN